jgi:hypothetical protein
MDMRDTGDNIGGIHAAWIGLVSALGAFPVGGSDTTISESIMNLLDDIPIHPFRAGFRVSSTDMDQGMLYPKNFDTGIPSDSDTVQALISKYEGRDVVLIYQDLDFNIWLAFDKLEPGKFLSEFAGGQDPSDGKLYTLSISNPGTWKRSKLTVV